MDFISFCPQDHKNLIYQHLNACDLFNLGFTAKTFYHDKNRFDLLVYKIVDECIYINIYDHTPLLMNQYFQSSVYYKEVMRIYFDRLKQISFSDIQTVIPLTVAKVRKQFEIREFKFMLDLFEFGIHFNYFVNAFLRLDKQNKIDILHNIGNYLYDLWKEAEKSQRCIYNTKFLMDSKDSFEFSQLFLSMHHILKNVFLEDPDLSIKSHILHLIIKIGHLTNDSKYFYIAQAQEDTETTCLYYSNDYDLMHFIRNLGLCPTDIKKVIEIGLFLSNLKLDSIYFWLLPTFISEVFDQFTEDTHSSEAKLIQDHLDANPDDYDHLKKLYRLSVLDFGLFENVLQNHLKKWNKK